ncbi:MAG: hypothetical protein E7Z84_00110 [Methanosphaera stadtmanae]|nr:hypothetical protein [Methanosphaera stadtmanae]
MEIETSARLHFSLIDLNGSSGRIDGGLGLTLESPSLIIQCTEKGSDTLITGKTFNQRNADEYAHKIKQANEKIQKYLGIDKKYTFNIKEIYPIHQGLGLGTQLLLSIAKLVASMNDVDLSTLELAKIIQRGGTSGIGVESFNSGGFIIDGGHKINIKNDFLPSSASKVAPPPVIARYDFPEDWKILLVRPNIDETISGKKEVNIFQDYSPIPLNDVEKISYLILMKLMPSIVEEDINSFGEAVNTIQHLGFKKVERSLQSEKITNIINCMQDNGIPCYGMSSFGPTCFGISEGNVKHIKKDLEDSIGNNGDVLITKAKNHGSIIRK